MTEWGASRHGTRSGWSRHRQLGERPCDACYAAKQEDDRRYKSAPEAQRRARLLAKAQHRALSRLQAIYPAVYAALYEEEKAKAYAQAESRMGTS